jgi:hypothetical protein
MRRAQFAELQHLLIVQDIALVVIAAALLIGIVMLIVAAGQRPSRDIRDTPARKPQTPRRPQ